MLFPIFLLLFLKAQSAALREAVQQAPKLAFKVPDLTIDRQIGFPSAVAMDTIGLIYVLCDFADNLAAIGSINWPTH